MLSCQKNNLELKINRNLEMISIHNILCCKFSGNFLQDFSNKLEQAI